MTVAIGVPDENDEVADWGRTLAPREVAAIFGVGVPTITRWADEDRFVVKRTLGGRRRFLESDVVEKFINGWPEGDQS